MQITLEDEVDIAVNSHHFVILWEVKSLKNQW